MRGRWFAFRMPPGGGASAVSARALAAATVALALLTSCASQPLATAAVPVVVASPTPIPAPVPPKRGAGRVLLTAPDGYVADGEGLSPFATDHPAVGNLSPELRAAVQRAATDAARDGVSLSLTSGWRSVRYQQSLLDAAVAQHGSIAEARRWVNAPDKSAHVSGKAVDVGPTTTALWLRRQGNRYGLCQIYANEMWHYELATRPGGFCPRPIPDASAG